MPEHDLGTAHGKIEIKADVKGVASSVSEIEALKAATLALDSPLSKLDDTMAHAAKSVGAMSARMSGLAEGFSNATSKITGVISQLSQIPVVSNLIDQAMQKAMATAQQAAITGWKAYGFYKDLRQPLSLVSNGLVAMKNHFLGIGAEINNFPRWTQTILRVGSVVGTVGVAGAFARKGIIALGGALAGAVTHIGPLHLLSGMLASQLETVSGNSNIFIRGLSRMIGGVQDADRGIARFYGSLKLFTGGMSGMILGSAAMVSGFKQLGSYLGMLNPKMMLMASGATLLPAVLSMASASLLNVASAVKTLSGVAFILPGALATAAIAGGVFKVAMSGMGGAIKAAMGDEKKFEEAIKDLSPGMQNVARAAQSLKAPFKELKEGIQETAFAGISKQIRGLGEFYMPVLSQGSLAVAQSLNAVKENFVHFLGGGNQLRDLGILFRATAGTVNNLSGAFAPMLAIFKNVAVVGAEALRDMTGSAEATTKKWSVFIDTARQTGEIRRWIDQGVQGFKDLGSTVASAGRGLKELFTALSGGGGAVDPLGRLADGAKKFEAAMSNPALQSSIREIMDRFKAVGASSFDMLITALQQVWGIIKSLAGFTEAFSTGFTGMFRDTLGFIGAIAQGLGNFASFLAPFAEIVGQILAMGAAFKIVMVILGPVIAMTKILGGSIWFLTSLGKTLTGLSAAFGFLSVSGGAVGSVFSRLSTLTGALAASVGPLMAVFAIAAAGFLAWQAHSSAMEAANNASAASAEHAKQSYTDLYNAFASSKGKVGKEVIDSMSKGLGKMQDDLATTSKATTGFMADMWAGAVDAFTVPKDFKGLGDMFKPEHMGAMSQANDKIDETARKAAEASASIKELGLSNDQLAVAVTGTDQEFANLVSRLSATSSGGAAAIEQFTEKRKGFQEIKTTMDAVGPSALQLADAVGKLADKSSSAADKMDAMKSALEAMGLLQVSGVEAFAKVYDAVDQLEQKMTSFTGPASEMGTALINNVGALDAVNPSAGRLWAIIEPLSTSLRAVAASGQDVDAAFGKMAPGLETLRVQTGLNTDQWNTLLRTMGLAPTELKTLYKLEGVEKAKQELFVLQQSIQSKPLNVPVSAVISSNEIVEQIKKAGADVKPIVGGTPGSYQVIVPDEEVKKRVMGLIDWAKANPVPIEVKPAPGAPGAPGVPGGPAPPGQALAPPSGIITPGAPAPAAPEAPSAVPGLDEANAKVDETKAKIEDLNNTPITLDVQQALDQINQVSSTISSATTRLEITFSTVGQVEIMTALGMIQGTVEGLMGTFATFVSSVGNSMSGAADTVRMFAIVADQILSDAANSANSSGQALGQGFADGISSKIGAAQAAAMALAEAAAAPLPRSPALIGPFSGQGWTLYRGIALSEGFAKGIEAGSRAATGAALSMAGQIAKVIEDLGNQGYLGPHFAARAGIIGAGKYRLQENAVEEDLHKANLKRIKDRDEAEARSKLKEEQQKAKTEAKKTPEERAAEEKRKAEEAKKVKKPEEIAKENRDKEDKAAQDRLAKALRVLEDGVSTQDEVKGAVNELSAQTEVTADSTKQALAVLGDQNASVEDVIRALDTVDNSIKTTKDIETQDYLKQIADATRTRRGIEAYDPLAGASKDIPKDIQSIVQNIFGLIKGIQEAVKGFTDLADLFARGIANTEDINKAVDGVQSLVSGIAGMADTAGSALTTFSNITAALGSVIPGVAQFTGAISAVTGAIGGVNQMIDLVQEGFKIGGGIVGEVLANLAGGPEGALYGNVKTLVDLNDMTIKRWSDQNPMDKRSSSLGPLGGLLGGGTTTNKAVENLNIYQGPGVDPYRMIDEAMFAIKAQRVGAYSE